MCICCSTCGLESARTWLKRGFSFDFKFGSRNKNPAFSAAKYDHVEMLEFLHKEAKLDLCSFYENGNSLLVYTLYRGSINSFVFLVKWHLDNNCFETFPQIKSEILEAMILASKTLLNSETQIDLCK